MLISLEDLFTKYNLDIKGIIHIGAHLLEELKIYHQLNIKNILWIEGNPTICNKAKSLFPKQRIINSIISDSNSNNKELDFIITNNGQSSSILELEEHKKEHPDVKEVNRIKVKSKTLKTLFNENNLDVLSYNFLNIDIQGAELLALKGMEDMLNFIDYLYLEVNTKHLYKNCPLINEIDDYVKNFGFVRKETNITSHNWGDAFYIKESA